MPTKVLLASRAEHEAMRRERRQAEFLKHEAERKYEAAIRDEAAKIVKSTRVRPPPLSPTRFAEALRSKAFGDGTDCAPIAGLYRAVMEDGFGGLPRLGLTECGWGDAEVGALATTLTFHDPS